MGLEVSRAMKYDPNAQLLAKGGGSKADDGAQNPDKNKGGPDKKDSGCDSTPNDPPATTNTPVLNEPPTTTNTPAPTNSGTGTSSDCGHEQNLDNATEVPGARHVVIKVQDFGVNPQTQ